MDDTQIQQSWDALNGNSVYRLAEPVFAGFGDIIDRSATSLRESLFIVPGDLEVSSFEDRLAESWSAAYRGDQSAMRTQSAIYRIILQAATRHEIDIVLVDLGPNLGALNRAVLSGSTHIIAPVSPDLFSIRGTRNLGSKLVAWQREWQSIRTAWSQSGNTAFGTFAVPSGQPKFLGYVTQQHNMRQTVTGMTQGWSIFGNQIATAIQNNIVTPLTPLNMVELNHTGSYELGQIPNLHSLIPYSLNARLPVFECSGNHGLRGAHITSASQARTLFEPMALYIERALLNPPSVPSANPPHPVTPISTGTSLHSVPSTPS